VVTAGRGRSLPAAGRRDARRWHDGRRPAWPLRVGADRATGRHRGDCRPAAAAL